MTLVWKVDVIGENALECVGIDSTHDQDIRDFESSLGVFMYSLNLERDCSLTPGSNSRQAWRSP